eukprot:CAMPEP_0204619720 /NCGR_PEP_ID=MMETSP0717-20131115/5998_1 /ASSEMBLY_ACC=CAM_ASM_000666 /TAXON_ID=230516 /ORGANISM="Chaetoceros curvisetus" /LENGTH=221 /DNA_ID=CAMNT_0051633771 /DNA_START=29 /DNA_END=694 /DNA_ORIENTATION=-
MGNTKRMSAEEKRKVVLEIYHRTKEVYTEKEILALATKAGVNQGTVQDINNSLVDDGKVDKEKIGGSNFFWSFPAKGDRLLQIELEKDQAEIELSEARVLEHRAKLADAKRGREDGDGDDNGDGNDGVGVRPKKLARLAELETKTKSLLVEFEGLKENDPQALADLEKELKLVTEGAHRWTDNIFICKSYLTKKRGMCNKEAYKLLGINSEFDYPDEKAYK